MEELKVMVGIEWRQSKSLLVQPAKTLGSCAMPGIRNSNELQPDIWDITQKMHQPGIEPGSHRWQRCILPLDH